MVKRGQSINVCMSECEYGLKYSRYEPVRRCVCVRATVYVCLPGCACVCMCVHSLCLFSAQQNLINSAGMEIISA